MDDISVSGSPAACKIGAVSIRRSTAFNEEERTKNWEAVTVKEIAEEIASRAGISLFYEAEEIPVKAVEQDKQTDCKFLFAVCEKYGLAMKVFAEKIVIFDEAVYEAAVPVATLKYEEFQKYTYKSTLLKCATQMGVAPVQPEADEMAPEGMLYVVQAGEYKSLNNARRLQQNLESMGVVSLIKQYKVAE